MEPLVPSRFPKLFSQARKHKLSLVLASQHVTQMPDKVKESAFANSGVLVSFNVDLDDAKLFAARMPDVSTEDITQQQIGECIARIGSDPFFVKTTLPKPPNDDSTTYIEQKMHGMITPLECERLQGFPDDWTASVPTASRYNCVGNAVTPHVVREIVQQLK